MTTENKKYLIYGGIGLTVIAVYFLLSNNSDDKNQPGSGDNTQLPPFNAKTVATELYEAMKTMGTEETDIVDSLTYVNQDQFAQVIAAFGKRAYNTTTGNIYAVWGFDLPLLGLKDWLSNELSTADYKILKYKYPKYL